MLSKRKKSKVISDNQTHKTDTGSSEVQIAILSERIKELAAHLKKNAKDNHSRRGLLRMVANRRSHLNYLQKNNPSKYASIMKKMKVKGGKSK